MTIDRDFYKDKLIKVAGNGLVKVITGIRRVGKSYLLFTIYRDYLRQMGVDDQHVITVQLDDDDFADLRLPRVLSAWIKAKLPQDGKPTYVFIDEIQLCKPPQEEIGNPTCVTFYDVLSSLMKKPGVDVYVTGSNSEMLSTDIVTNFRDRSTEIRVWPLCFSEYHAVSGLEKADAWDRYLMWGGMPLAVLASDDAARSDYLESLFKRVYIKDIAERYHLQDSGYVMGKLLDVLSSNIGCLTNPHRLAATLKTECKVNVSEPTLARYLDHICNSFLFHQADRWDVKGNRYLASPSKFYAVDLGLRNARVNFRQNEMSHLMENAIYNELARRGCRVDVGVVQSVEKDAAGKSVKKQREIDFVVNAGMKKVYIQSAFEISTGEKREQEIASLRRTGDFFQKIIVTGGNSFPRLERDGCLSVGVIPFLMDPTILGSIV